MLRNGMKRLSIILIVLVALSGIAFGEETIRVGAYQNPPKVFMTPDGRVTGVFPEVLEEIAKQSGWEIDYVFGSWQDCLKRLQDGTIDLMVDMAISEERKERYAFSKEPVLVNWGTAFSRADITVESFLDMEGLTVAVMRGSIHTEGPQGIKSLMTQFGIPCRYMAFDNYQQVLMIVDEKQADVGIVNRLYGTLHSDAYEVRPSPIIFNPRVLAFSVRKDDTRGHQLLQKIDDWMQKAKQNPGSVYHEVLAYYLGGGKRKWKGEVQKYSHPLRLTRKERQWILAHPVVRFSVDPGFAPFEFLTEDGRYRGMAADFMTLIENKTGLDFELVQQKSWSDSLDAIKKGEADILPCIGYSDERRSYLSFSEPYLKFARVIVTPMDSPVSDISDLHGLRVGVQVDSSHHAFLTEDMQFEPVLYKTYEEGLLAVSRGVIDAVVGNLAVTTHLMHELALTNIKMAGYADPRPQPLAIGIRKDRPELVSILNKALRAITMRQRNEVFAKWLPLPVAAPSRIDLSQAEREWLLMHPRIRIAWDREWAPIEFADTNGTPRGISMEYLKAIEEILGIRFDTSMATDWQTTYGKLKRREVDMSTCLSITPERLEHLTFTEPYVSSPVVLFSRSDMPYISRLSELKNLRVAVVGGYATDEWITRDHPQLNLTRTASISDAFGLLQKGAVDVFVGGVLTGNYYLSKLRLNGIKIAGDTPYDYKLRMAVRKDWELFAGILHKVLAVLPEEDKTAFYRKWVWIGYEHGFDYSLFGKILVGTFVVILVFVYWNRRLKAEIGRRKRSQAALAESERALRASYAELKELGEAKDNLTHMIVHDMRSPLMTVKGSLDLLKMDLNGELPGPDGVYSLHMAQAGVQTATNMAQALLDIGRLESGRIPLVQADIDMKVVAQDAIRAMAVQARMAKVKLELSGASSQGRADPDIMQRVLVNLIGNGIKASPEGGSVEVQTMADASRITVKVCDSGDGIPERFQKTIFDKFTTVETGGRQKTSVGLGLAFCKLAVEAHGGRIHVESEVGTGSVFCFRMPINGASTG